MSARAARGTVRRATRLRLVALSMIVMLAPLVPTLESGASPGTPLPLGGFFDIEVDRVSGHVFVSGGAGSSSVAVLDLQGELIDEIPDLPDASGLIVVDGELFVAQEAGTTVDVLDARTFDHLGTIELPFPVAGSIAWAGGKLWFQRGRCGSWGRLAWADPASGDAATLDSGVYHCPTFAGSPTDPDLLVVGDRSISGPVRTYDVSGQDPVLLADSSEAGIPGERAIDLAITADGARLITATTGPSDLRELYLPDLMGTGMAYPPGATPVAVAISEDGWVAGGSWLEEGSTIRLYPEWEAWPATTIEPAGDLAPRGLAFGSAGTLLAVTDGPTVETFEVPASPDPPPDPMEVPEGLRLSPLHRFSDILVDRARERVLVSGGLGDSSILVLDLDGRPEAVIAGVPGAAGMVIDEATLYVAREGGAAIEAIDAETLEPSSTLHLPFMTSGAIAAAGGKLWVIDQPCSRPGRLTQIDPAGLVAESHGSDDLWCPRLDVTPTAPHLLVAGTLGGHVATFDLSGEGVEELARRRIGTSVHDLAISPDPARVIVAAKGDENLVELRTQDLSPAATFPTGPDPVAVDVSPSGDGWILAGRSLQPSVQDNDPNIHVFDYPSSVPELSYRIGGRTPEGLAPRGLAFGSDPSMSYAVRTDGEGQPILLVLPRDVAPANPPPVTTTLALTASASTVTGREAVVFTARMDPPPPSRERVKVRFSTPGGGVIVTQPLDGEGTATLFQVVSKRTRMVATWEGSSTYAASSSGVVTVDVIPKARTWIWNPIARKGKVSMYPAGRRLIQIGKLSPSSPGKVLRVVVQEREGGRWKRAFRKRVTIRDVGPAKIRYRLPPGKYRTRVLFPGNDDLLPARSRWMRLKVIRRRK